MPEPTRAAGLHEHDAARSSCCVAQTKGMAGGEQRPHDGPRAFGRATRASTFVLRYASLGFFLVAFPTRVATASDATIHAEVDSRRIGVEDRLQLSIALSGRDLNLESDPPPPPVANLRVVGGPILSIQSFIVNGVFTQGRTYTYILQPQAVGKAEIGAVRVKFQDGTEKATSPITIDVVEGTTRTPAPRRGVDPFDLFEDDTIDRLIERRRGRSPAPQPKIVARVVASRNRLFVGEPVLLTYFVYTQIQVSDFGFRDPPKFSGFWSEEPEAPPGRIQGERATLDNETYLRYPIQRNVLFPTRPGTLPIPPAMIKIVVPRVGFFDTGSIMVERETNTLSITADPIPGAPDFAGAVGDYRTSAALDKTEAPLGEAVTLRFRVEGSGNLKWIDQGPEVAISSAKVYPPQVKSRLKTTNKGIVGSKTWEYVVVPETSGRIEIPGLAFSFFDPRNKRIVRSETKPIALDVTAGSSLVTTASAPLPTAVVAQANALALRDVLDPPRRFLPRIPPGVLGLLLGGVALAHLLLWGGAYVRFSSLGGHGTISRMSARKALSEIGRVGRGRMSKEAAAALIEKALADVFGDLDDAEGGERERAARAVIDDVRFLRYAPQLGDYTEKIRELAARAGDVVRRWA
ncbi:MAG: protein BatD [Vicinamibacteria bacterium]|nr:protein BatD [Vicinamibacteria bacterium]